MIDEKKKKLRQVKYCRQRQNKIRGRWQGIFTRSCMVSDLFLLVIHPQIAMTTGMLLRTSTPKMMNSQ